MILRNFNSSSVIKGRKINHSTNFINLSELTILIPTLRWDYVQESINYYSNFQFLNIIYIVNNKSDNSSSINTTSNISIKVIDDKSFLSHWEFGLKIVNTKYVLLCADDDFVDIDELLKGYLFLNINPGFKVYYGPSQVFQSTADDTFFFHEFIKNKSERIIDHQNFRIKFEKFFGPYNNILWSLFDTRELLKIMSFIIEFRPLNHNFIELGISIYFLHRGNIYIAENIWNYRRTLRGSWGSQHAGINILDEEAILFAKSLDKFIGSNLTMEALKIYIKNTNKLNIQKFFILRNYLRYLKRILIKK